MLREGFKSVGICTRLHTLLPALFRENGEYGLRSHARGMCRGGTLFGKSPARSAADQLMSSGGVLSMICA